MSLQPAWLPDLVNYSEYKSNWADYCEALHGFFVEDFVTSKPQYVNKRFALKKHPEYDGKSATFWHLISEGNVEDDRTPAFRRCERIRWPRAIINHHSSQEIKTWQNERNGNTRILLALQDFSYVVILEDREEYVLLWSAYPVEQNHRRKKLAKEYDDYSRKMAEAALRDGFVTPSTHGG